jgi:hypothetical protein
MSLTLDHSDLEQAIADLEEAQSALIHYRLPRENMPSGSMIRGMLPLFERRDACWQKVWDIEMQERLDHSISPPHSSLPMLLDTLDWLNQTTQKKDN